MSLDITLISIQSNITLIDRATYFKNLWTYLLYLGAEYIT